MNKAGTGFILIVAVMLLAFAAHGVWLPLPARFLLVRDDIGKADCIVVLQGSGDFFRYKKAVELYTGGYAKAIVVSNLPAMEIASQDYFHFAYKWTGDTAISPEEYTLGGFKYFGKDTRDIFFTASYVTSTYEEAVAAKKLLAAKGFRSCIVVTSTYHMRRSLAIFEHVFRGTGVTLYHCTAENRLLYPARWWQKERDVKMVVMEYLSMIQNFIFDFVLKRERASFDSV